MTSRLYGYDDHHQNCVEVCSIDIMALKGGYAEMFFPPKITLFGSNENACDGNGSVKWLLNMN